MRSSVCPLLLPSQYPISSAWGPHLSFTSLGLRKRGSGGGGRVLWENIFSSRRFVPPKNISFPPAKKLQEGGLPPTTPPGLEGGGCPDTIPLPPSFRSRTTLEGCPVPGAQGSPRGSPCPFCSGPPLEPMALFPSPIPPPSFPSSCPLVPPDPSGRPHGYKGPSSQGAPCGTINSF